MRSRPRYFATLTIVLSYIAAAAAGTDPWLEQARLVAGDGQASDQLGISVALDDDTAVVGAWFARVGDNAGQGAAYVFVREHDAWVQQAKLTAADGAASDWFGTAVAVSGDTVLVGASQELFGGGGAAYVFVREDEAWHEQARLTAADTTAGDNFGIAVALAGDIALIGANRAGLEGVDQQGAAYLFEREEDTWSERARLVPDDFPLACISLLCPRMGNAVALWGDTALVGVQNMMLNGVERAGAAFVFVRDGESWSEQAMLTRTGGAPGDQFGASVALWDDTALIGVNLANTGGDTNRGAAHVFTRDGATWSASQELVAAGGAADDQFGMAVALQNGTALIGAHHAGVDGNPSQGAAYMFTRNGNGTWGQRQILTALTGAAGDRFGVSVALSDNSALIGAHEADVGDKVNQGAVYVFAPPEPLPDPIFDDRFEKKEADEE